MFGIQFPASPMGKAVVGAPHLLRRLASRARVRLCLGAGATILLGCAVPSGAKTVKSVAPRASRVSQNASGLSAGDVISVKVLGQPDSSSESLTIPDSGQINVPLAGTVKIVGQTPAQAARTIARALSRELVEPQVTVELKQSHARFVVVIGAVAKTSPYEIQPGWRISNAIAAAGGLQGRLDETVATLTRAGVARPISVDLKTVMANTSSPKNLYLREGDTLSLRALDPKLVMVTGDVGKQGAFPLRSAPRLLDALAVAEGTKQGNARSRVTLFRNGHKVALDLARAQALNTLDTNVPLQDGDRIVVSTIANLVVTVSAPSTFVRSSGTIELAPDSGVAQAVAQAGLTVLPEEVVATIVRGRQIIPVDLERVGIDPVANLPLQTGDVINIGEPKVIRIQVAGSVNKQGALRMAPGTTLLDALNKGAGGISATLQPEDVRVSVIRTRSPRASLVMLPVSGGSVALPNVLDGGAAPASNEAAPALNAGAPEVSEAAPRAQVVGDRELISVNALALLRQNDLRQNIVLQDGDLVSVTQAKNPTVIVSGEVGKPGPYQLAEGAVISDLLASAGGQTSAAALRHVVLRRAGQSRTLDVYDEVRNGGKAGVVLQDGDTVIVPENPLRVTVINGAVKPGPVPIPENGQLTLIQALNAAGGPRDRGVKEIGLLRPNPAVQGGVERRVVSLQKFYAGDLSQDVVLRPGDFVYVPDAKAPKTNLLGFLGQVVGTVTGLRYITGG